MKIIRFFCTLVSIFACCLANAESKNMLIFGVYDEISYEPLSGVEFSLTNDNGSAVPIDSILAKANGQYQIMLSVPDGNYSLFAEKDGYNPYVKAFKSRFPNIC